MAQWWLARVLGLGWLARMWSALLAVVAGNIAGRMQMGWFGVALATASVALIFPPFIHVALTGSRRAGVFCWRARRWRGKDTFSLGLFFCCH
ncbi:MAG: hypothetical protein DCC52_16905 [Chloroflexi bacterium]|nr:MAG: hypothetical protein DCC52_16905 [Chloroflexota bacterium]